MRHFFKWFFAVLAVLALAWAVFFARPQVMRALFNVRSGIQNAFSATSTAETIQALSVENESLRAELRAANATSTVTGRYHYRVAEVYSRYPYNDEGMLAVDAGSADGIRVGMPVVEAEGVLLGKVVRVERTESEVQTIFSPDWKSSVAVGTSSVKAVLEGGITPTLSLIPKGTAVGNGDEITNISPDYPFGAYVGEVNGIRAVPNDVWQTADVGTSFKLEGVTEALIVLDFP